MSGGIKKFWMKNEIVCVCYADGTWFAGGCRCPKHRNTPQRSRDSEIQDTREDTYSNDDDAHDDDYCEVKPKKGKPKGNIYMFFPTHTLQLINFQEKSCQLQ
jgi:hypothetical protein